MSTVSIARTTPAQKPRGLTKISSFIGSLLKIESCFDQGLLSVTLLLGIVSMGSSLRAGPAMDILKPIKSDEAYEKQLPALVALGEKGVPDLAKAVNDEAVDPHARWIAAYALARIGSSPSLDALDKCVNAKVVTVRMGCVQALGEVGSSRATLSLLKGLDDKAAMVRIAVIHTIVNQKLPNATELLSKELFESRNFTKKSSLPIRTTILNGFAELKDPASAVSIAKVLEEKSPGMRMQACSVLEKIFPSAPALNAEPKKCADKWKEWLKKNSKV